MSFWCHHLDQITNEILTRISALASKKRSNQKGSEIKILHLVWCKVALFFWFDLFLEVRVEILEKKLLVFWSKQYHQKDILKLTDLYLIQSKDIEGHLFEKWYDCLLWFFLNYFQEKY
jgi:hypothetical protein